MEVNGFLRAEDEPIVETPSTDDLRRYALQEKLEGILGSRNVYFQPPSDKKMQYPCIVYQLDNVWAQYAANRPYVRTKRYQVTWIGEDPDDDTPDKIGALPMSKFSRFFTSSGLNHHVYQLYW